MRKAEILLRQSLRIITGARRKTYGKPERNFETISGFWNTYLGARPDPDAPISPADVCAMMGLLKFARIAETPGHSDSWRDVAGYAAVGAEVIDADLSDQPMPVDVVLDAPPVTSASFGVLPEDDPNGTP